MDKINLRYLRGKIYTVRCYDDDRLIYVGSTIQPLSVRMANHRCDTTTSLYKYVNGNWKNWYIELYEEYPCDNKELLEKREGEVTRLIGNINKRIEGRTYKEWYEDNKKKIAEKGKIYYQKNKEKKKEYDKQYRKTNIDKRKEQQKEYQNANKEKITEYQKEYHKANKEVLNENKKQYRNDNKEKLAEKAKEKVICDNCGSEIRKDGLSKHKKSKKCKNYNITK